MASPWLQGMQFGFDASLRMQQLRSQQAERQMKERAAAEALRMKIEENNLAIQERADMVKAITAAREASSPTITVPMQGQEGIGDMAPPIMKVDNPNPMTQESAAMQFVLPVVAKYRPDKVPDFLEGVALAEYRKKVGTEFTPTAGTVELPDGTTRQYVKTGRGSAQVVQDIEGRQQRVGLTKWALANAPELMETDKSGMVFLPPEKFNEAARRSGIPSGVKTDMMTQIQSTAGAFEVGRKLLPLLTPENVGVRGFIGRKIEEQGMAQLFPGMKIGSATETLAVASNFRAGLVRALRSDSNINKDEREQIIEGLPTPENMLSSVQDSKVKLATQLELAAIKSRAAANALGKPITPFFLKIDEIEQMVNSKSITPEEGAKLWNANAWRLVEQIRNEVQR